MGSPNAIAHFSGQASPYAPQLLGAPSKWLKFAQDLISNEVAAVPKTTEMSGLYSQGVEFTSWTSPPDHAYMMSAPLSMPLIFVAQVDALAQVFNQVGDYRVPTRFCSAIGHSQGTAAALALACSTSECLFFEFGRRLLLTLFWMALRSHAPGGSCMLAVLKVSKPELQAQVDIFNAANASQSQSAVELVIQNGPRAHAVVGLPTDVNKFHDHISMWSPETIVLRVLDVSAPFHHSSALHDATALLWKDLAVKGLRENSLQGADLSIPVYDCATGRNLQNTERVLQALVQGMMADPVSWTECLRTVVEAHPGAAMVDFGPGGKASAITMTKRAFAEVSDWHKAPPQEPVYVHWEHEFIQLTEVEDGLCKLPGVQGATALLKDKILVSFLEAPAAPTADGRAMIKEWLKQNKPTYAVSAVAVVVEAFPRTSGGQVDRRALGNMDVITKDGTVVVYPRTPKTPAKIRVNVESMADVWEYTCV